MARACRMSTYAQQFAMVAGVALLQHTWSNSHACHVPSFILTRAWLQFQFVSSCVRAFGLRLR